MDDQKKEYGLFMEVECVKYKEKMDSSQARCRHPGAYCQHRSSCMIQFIEREERKERPFPYNQKP
jgi:hypothetical protein